MITPRDLAWNISHDYDINYLDCLETVLSYVRQFLGDTTLFSNDIPRHDDDDENDLGDGDLTQRGAEIIRHCIEAKESAEPYSIFMTRPKKEHNMPFDQALAALLDGKKITRKAWFLPNGTEINHIKIRRECKECRTTEELVFLAMDGDGKYHPFTFGSEEIFQNDWMTL